MADRGRVVVVAAGFGLWQGGKCLAAGKWTDIAKLHAFKRSADSETLSVTIELRDGSAVEILEDAPGWMTFVNAAPSRLPGTPTPEEWMPGLRAKAGIADRALFARAKGR